MKRKKTEQNKKIMKIRVTLKSWESNMPQRGNYSIIIGFALFALNVTFSGKKL